MAWNTTHTRFYSSDLAGLECGSYLKIPRRDRKTVKVAHYTGALEVGQCVAMLRVPTGARITNARLVWTRANTTASLLAVGDPYACARFLGPIHTSLNSGDPTDSGSANGRNCLPWGFCGVLTKTGTNGDGCGLFYQYTCETDIIVTNLYHAGNAAEGGFLGGTVTAAVANQPGGGKFTGGQLVLMIEYLQQS